MKVLFVYNNNALVTSPDQNRIQKGLEREDLFTVVFDQVRTDTARYADVILPATTFLEHYDIARGYGNYALQLVKPVIEPVGESRPNVVVFGELAARLGVGDEEDETDTLLRVAAGLPEADCRRRDGTARGGAPSGRPPGADGGRAAANARREDPSLSRSRSRRRARSTATRPTRRRRLYPLALISPASEKTVSSTFGQLRRNIARLQIHPDDAESRGITEGDTVRVFNALGDVHCLAHVTSDIARGVLSLPKGLWRQSTLNGETANALAPATLERHSGGACFNDARVEVAKIVGAAFGAADVSLFVPARPNEVH